MSDKTDDFEVIRKWGERLEKFWHKDSTGKHVDQKEWADQIGISSSNLGMYCKGAQAPKLQMVLRIREWLKTRGYPDGAFLWLMDGGPVPDDLAPNPSFPKKNDLNSHKRGKIIIGKWKPKTDEQSVRMIA